MSHSPTITGWGGFTPPQRAACGRLAAELLTHKSPLGLSSRDLLNNTTGENQISGDSLLKPHLETESLGTCVLSSTTFSDLPAGKLDSSTANQHTFSLSASTLLESSSSSIFSGSNMVDYISRNDEAEQQLILMSTPSFSNANLHFPTSDSSYLQQHISRVLDSKDSSYPIPGSPVLRGLPQSLLGSNSQPQSALSQPGQPLFPIASAPVNAMPHNGAMDISSLSKEAAPVHDGMHSYPPQVAPIHALQPSPAPPALVISTPSAPFDGQRHHQVGKGSEHDCKSTSPELGLGSPIPCADICRVTSPSSSMHEEIGDAAPVFHPSHNNGLPSVPNTSQDQSRASFATSLSVRSPYSVAMSVQSPMSATESHLQSQSPLSRKRSTTFAEIPDLLQLHAKGSQISKRKRVVKTLTAARSMQSVSFFPDNGVRESTSTSVPPASVLSSAVNCSDTGATMHDSTPQQSFAFSQAAHTTAFAPSRLNTFPSLLRGDDADAQDDQEVTFVSDDNDDDSAVIDARRVNNGRSRAVSFTIARPVGNTMKPSVNDTHTTLEIIEDADFSPHYRTQRANTYSKPFSSNEDALNEHGPPSLPPHDPNNSVENGQSMSDIAFSSHMCEQPPLCGFLPDEDDHVQLLPSLGHGLPISTELPRNFPSLSSQPLTSVPSKHDDHSRTLQHIPHATSPLMSAVPVPHNDMALNRFDHRNHHTRTASDILCPTDVQGAYSRHDHMHSHHYTHPYHAHPQTHAQSLSTDATFMQTRATSQHDYPYSQPNVSMLDGSQSVSPATYFSSHPAHSPAYMHPTTHTTSVPPHFPVIHVATNSDMNVHHGNSYPYTSRDQSYLDTSFSLSPATNTVVTPIHGNAALRTFRNSFPPEAYNQDMIGATAVTTDGIAMGSGPHGSHAGHDGAMVDGCLPIYAAPHMYPPHSHSYPHNGIPSTMVMALNAPHLPSSHSDTMHDKSPHRASRDYASPAAATRNSIRAANSDSYSQNVDTMDGKPSNMGMGTRANRRRGGEEKQDYENRHRRDTKREEKEKKTYDYRNSYSSVLDPSVPTTHTTPSASYAAANGMYNVLMPPIPLTAHTRAQNPTNAHVYGQPRPSITLPPVSVEKYVEKNKAKSPSASDIHADIRCICGGQTEDNRSMLMCDVCGYWWHFGCAGVFSGAEAEEINDDQNGAHASVIKQAYLTNSMGYTHDDITKRVYEFLYKGASNASTFNHSRSGNVSDEASAGVNGDESTSAATNSGSFICLSCRHIAGVDTVSLRSDFHVSLVREYGPVADVLLKQFSKLRLVAQKRKDEGKDTEDEIATDTEVMEDYLYQQRCLLSQTDGLHSASMSEQDIEDIVTHCVWPLPLVNPSADILSRPNIQYTHTYFPPSRHAAHLIPLNNITATANSGGSSPGSSIALTPSSDLGKMSLFPPISIPLTHFLSLMGSSSRSHVHKLHFDRKLSYSVLRAMQARKLSQMDVVNQCHIPGGQAALSSFLNGKAVGRLVEKQCRMRAWLTSIGRESRVSYQTYTSKVTRGINRNKEPAFRDCYIDITNYGALPNSSVHSTSSPSPPSLDVDTVSTMVAAMEMPLKTALTSPPVGIPVFSCAPGDLVDVCVCGTWLLGRVLSVQADVTPPTQDHRSHQQPRSSRTNSSAPLPASSPTAASTPYRYIPPRGTVTVQIQSVNAHLLTHLPPAVRSGASRRELAVVVDLPSLESIQYANRLLVKYNKIFAADDVQTDTIPNSPSPAPPSLSSPPSPSSSSVCAPSLAAVVCIPEKLPHTRLMQLAANGYCPPFSIAPPGYFSSCQV